MEDPPRSTSRALFFGSSLATFLVVVGFMAVTIVAQQRARVIDQMALSISENAAPSIDHLTTARGELHHLNIAVRDALEKVAMGRSLDRRVIDRSIKAFDAAMSEYVELPTYSGERLLHHAAAEEVGAYQKVVEDLLQLLSEKQIDRARAMVDSRLSPASNAADQAMERLIRLNGGEAARLSVEIQRARVGAAQLSYVLHFFAGLLAAIVMTIVVQTNRGRARLADTQAQLQGERKKAAEERAAELDMFAARVAHDIKNPISAILLNIMMATRSVDDSDKVLKSLERARRAADHATQITDGLLAFARASGAVARDGSADLADALMAVLADLAADAERAGVEVHVASFGAVRVACPLGPLLSIFGNLLRNAVKYVVDGPSLEHHIHVRAVTAGERVRVEIEDTGPGISPGLELSLFEPYVRGPDRGHPGLGLGLATVKRLVEAYGGTVGVVPAATHGSCFWFELPLAKSVATAVRHEQPDLH